MEYFCVCSYNKCIVKKSTSKMEETLEHIHTEGNRVSELIVYLSNLGACTQIYALEQMKCAARSQRERERVIETAQQQPKHCSEMRELKRISTHVFVDMLYVLHAARKKWLFIILSEWSKTLMTSMRSLFCCCGLKNVKPKWNGSSDHPYSLEF